MNGNKTPIDFFTIIEPFRGNRVKIQYESLTMWQAQVLETAIMMIPGNGRECPFINPFNYVVEFRFSERFTHHEALCAMIDNYRCLTTYYKFIETLDFEWIGL
jgi:hypothetical protein